MDDHGEERDVEFPVDGRDDVRGAIAVDDARMRAVARGLGAHLRRRLHGDDAGVEGIGQQRREAPRAGAEVEHGELRAHTPEVAGDRRHPEAAGIGRKGTAGAIRAVEAPVVVDPRHQSASGSGSPWNASVGSGPGGVIPRRSASA